MRVLIPGIIIFIGFAGLIGMAVATMGIPEVQVHQVRSAEFANRELKVQGVISAIESEVRPLRFTVQDRERPTALLEVEIDDVRPDIFKVGNDVAVIGTYDSESGRLAGHKIFTKCPSKYEAEGGTGDAYSAESSYPAKSEPKKPEASGDES